MSSSICSRHGAWFRAGSEAAISIRSPGIVSSSTAAPVYLAIPDALTTPRGGLRGGAARLLFTTAREAIRRREAGERRYIRWFETALASAPLASASDPSR